MTITTSYCPENNVKQDSVRQKTLPTADNYLLIEQKLVGINAVVLAVRLASHHLGIHMMRHRTHYV